MNNPRNLLASQDVVDNLTSTAATLPLSANQGRVLEEQINNISPVTSDQITATFVPGADQTVKEIAIGELKWDDTNDQLFITLTDTSLTQMMVFSEVSNYSGGGAEQILNVRGSFVVTPTADYYFSATGNVDAALSIPTDVSQVKLHVSFYPSGAFGITYYLDLVVQRSDVNEIIVEGIFTPFDKSLFIGFRMEARSYSNPGLSMYSFGGNENNTNTGIIVPVDITFTEISYMISDGFFEPSNIAFNVLQNGVNVATFTYHPGARGAVVPITPQVTFNAGDRLSFTSGPTVSGGATGVESVIIGQIVG